MVERTIFSPGEIHGVDILTAWLDGLVLLLDLADVVAGDAVVDHIRPLVEDAVGELTADDVHVLLGQGKLCLLIRSQADAAGLVECHPGVAPHCVLTHRIGEPCDWVDRAGERLDEVHQVELVGVRAVEREGTPEDALMKMGVVHRLVMRSHEVPVERAVGLEHRRWSDVGQNEVSLRPEIHARCEVFRKHEPRHRTFRSRIQIREGI